MPKKESNSVLLIWNAMAATQVSGGDIYIKKFIEYCPFTFDVLLSEHGLRLINKKAARHLYVTDNENAAGTIKLSLLYIKRFFRARKIVKTNDSHYDIVLASSPFLPDILPALFKNASHRAVVFFHLIPKRKGHDFRTKLRFFVARTEQKVSLFIIGRYFDTILAGNIVVKKELEAKFPNKKIVIADAGIDTKLMDRYKVTAKDPNMATFIGRLTTQKGVMDLVRICEKIQKEKPEFYLDVIGDGQDRHLFEEAIIARNIKNIHLKGFVTEQEKYESLYRSTFFIFPSYEEGWGIALAEALYAGVSVFCYELPHYESIFGSYPYYVPLGAYDDLAYTILEQYDQPLKNGQVLFMRHHDDRAVIDRTVNEMNA